MKQAFEIECPCCGRLFVFSPTSGGIAANEANASTEHIIVQIASDLGVELGALEGGEKIGDY